ncbi:ribokinase [Mediterraneibacter sp. NSJ-55]|uniref:Ribokinase n=1 Tax=Mediterraneibacter hominis TaxID=2763054 RepID=A0A923RQF9_9FIRM|nr:ribokinase [Mediterraneibacter hominis]MBC5689534.1 ribokinase [Mediterraneibacter hominis]
MNILNFGSLNIDYVYEVEHFVRKGETISSKNLRVSCGGKGLNQSVALSRAGLHVYHAGMIGTDGTFLEDILKDAGVDTRYVMTSEQTRTGNAIIQNDAQGDNCILLYGGANQAVTREFIDCVLQNFEKDDWLLLQNEINEIPYIVESAHKKGIHIALNPSPMDSKIFDINLKHISCFILNEIEAQELIKDTGNDNVLLKKVHAAFPHAEIVLTLGERGALYLGKEGHITQESYPVTAIDTTAAGDTFTGYYLAGQLKGFCAKESMQMAAKAASITVSRKGAALSIPKIDEVLSTK